MSESLQQLEALRRDPRLHVTPEQRPAIVGQILHHLMWPYFLKRTPEMQEKFSEANYHAFNAALAGYCLREYIEHPEPSLTIEFIKGLHRQFYSNAPSVPVKAMDGSMITMVPGEFKTTPVFIRRHSAPGEWFETTAPDDVVRDIEHLLVVLHDEKLALFQRYLHLIVDLMHLHPFPDNNGKVAMLLGDLFLLKHGIQPANFAQYKWANEQGFYQLLDRYFLNPARDISIFFRVVLKCYGDCGTPPASSQEHRRAHSNRPLLDRSLSCQ